ncbi:hypothetical protein [Helicobacter pylori]|uniref:hypothetical protein n=1 Tax=Helicobacter pylori TaxID=210 RepID=UPI001E5CB4EE|nr:hypothetical protein [Helicobacter pylori]
MILTLLAFITHDNKTIQQPTANLLCQRTIIQLTAYFKSILQHYRLKYQLF